MRRKKLVFVEGGRRFVLGPPSRLGEGAKQKRECIVSSSFMGLIFTQMGSLPSVPSVHRGRRRENAA